MPSREGLRGIQATLASPCLGTALYSKPACTHLTDPIEGQEIAESGMAHAFSHCKDTARVLYIEAIGFAFDGLTPAGSGGVSQRLPGLERSWSPPALCHKRDEPNALRCAEVVGAEMTTFMRLVVRSRPLTLT